jgi:hypothetical protein
MTQFGKLLERLAHEGHVTPSEADTLRTQFNWLYETVDSISKVSDGDVATLLKTNQIAADTLRRINPKRHIKVVLEFDMDMPDYVDGVSDAHHVIVGHIAANIGDEGPLSEPDMIKSIDISTV